MKKSVLIPVLSIVLAGCKVGPEYRRPEDPIPAQYSHAAAATQTNTAAANLADWWTVFNDPQLAGLIRDAEMANHDIRIAISRVREARAIRGVIRSALFPQVNGGADYRRARESENGLGRQLSASGQSL